jgi:hypothetical protein
MRLAATASLALSGLAIVYTAVLRIIPSSLGVTLLGDTWTGASSVLVPVALASAAASLKLGPVVFLYGRGLARRTFPLVSTLAVLAVVLMAAGAWVGQAPGLAWGLLIAQLVVVPLWFLQLRSVLRRDGATAGNALPEEPDPYGIGSQQQWVGGWTEGPPTSDGDGIGDTRGD